MSLASGEGLSAADVAAVTGNSGGHDVFGNNGLFWVIILFLFAMMTGWGNNNNGGNNGGGIVGAYGLGVQEGFNQQALMSGIGAIQAAQNANQMGLVTTINANQMANMQSMNSLAMGLQNCCCENRAGLADLKYTVATENCSDRQAINEAVYNLTTQMNQGFQAMHNEFCEDRLSRKDEIIADLNRKLSEANANAARIASEAKIIANNEAQTSALEQYLAPVARPAYIVQNPNGCNQTYGCSGCGYTA